MDKSLLAPRLLQLLKEGRFFHVFFGWVLRIQSVLAVLGGLLLSIELWRAASGVNAAGMPGLLILQVLLAVAFYFVVHLSWLRASELLTLGDAETGGGSEAIPVTQVLLRLGGEIYASLIAAFSLGGALLKWFSGGEGFRALSLVPIPEMYGGDVFLAGLTILGFGLLMAACGLLGAYFLADFISVFVNIEKNTRKG